METCNTEQLPQFREQELPTTTAEGKEEEAYIPKEICQKLWGRLTYRHTAKDCSMSPFLY